MFLLIDDFVLSYHPIHAPQLNETESKDHNYAAGKDLENVSLDSSIPKWRRTKDICCHSCQLTKKRPIAPGIARRQDRLAMRVEMALPRTLGWKSRALMMERGHDFPFMLENGSVCRECARTTSEAQCG